MNTNPVVNPAQQDGDIGQFEELALSEFDAIEASLSPDGGIFIAPARTGMSSTYLLTPFNK